MKSTVQAVARLFVGCARFEPPHQVQPPEARFFRRAQSAALAPQQRLLGERDGDGGLIIHLQGAGERGRCDADDGKRLLVEFERLANDSATRAQPLLPKLMAEHNHWRGAWLVIIVSNGASQARLHSQPGIIVAGHGLPVDDLRLIGHYRVHFMYRSESKEIGEGTFRRLRPRLAHLFKDLVAKQRKPPRARRPGDGRRSAHAINSERKPGLPFKQHQAFRLRNRQGLQQHGIYHTE